MIREEPERFFLPKGNNMLTQEKYNKLLGIPADYKPKYPELFK